MFQRFLYERSSWPGFYGNYSSAEFPKRVLSWGGMLKLVFKATDTMWLEEKSREVANTCHQFWSSCQCCLYLNLYPNNLTIDVVSVGDMSVVLLVINFVSVVCKAMFLKLKYLFMIFYWLQDLSAGDVKPFKAFHYNGLGIREEDGTKKV